MKARLSIAQFLQRKQHHYFHYICIIFCIGISETSAQTQSSHEVPSSLIPRPVRIRILPPTGPNASNPFAESRRFIRGEENVPSARSFVVPLDSQKGVELHPMGDNAGKFSGTAPWFSRIRKFQKKYILKPMPDEEGQEELIGTSSPKRQLLFENPLVAFGSSAGATPLYVDQEYSFGIHGGANLADGVRNTSDAAEIFISAYTKSSLDNGQSNVAPVFTIPIRIPRKGTAEWARFVGNGYKMEIPHTQTGLNTTLRLVKGMDPTAWGSYSGDPYILTFRASNPDYYYKVETTGFVVEGNTHLPVTESVNAGDPSQNTLFTMNFDRCPPWRSALIHRPHFDGMPLPSEYQGKSLEELLQVKSAVNKDLGTPLASYLQIDNSPELRSHPILDKLVQNMGSDPLALCNYVQNEIELTDAISYNDEGDLQSTSINAGGITRGALATYLEKQGSPAEQCALLIYLLRKAGTPAVYIFPPKNQLKMLDARMSKMLRMQIRGLPNHERNQPFVPDHYHLRALALLDSITDSMQAEFMHRQIIARNENPPRLKPNAEDLRHLDEWEQYVAKYNRLYSQFDGTWTNIPHLISVNYPWVAAQVTVDGEKKWVHIFPWIKDTEIKEGPDLFDKMPRHANTAALWTALYLKKDPEILSLEPENDTVANLFPKYVEKQLRKNYPGLSMEDLGMKIRDRRHYYARWEDFPQPWSVVEGAREMTVRENLSFNEKNFDTLRISLFSDRNNNNTWDAGEPQIQTEEIRLLDLHNRRLVLHFKQTSGNNHNMFLTLAPFRPGTTGVGTFQANTDFLQKQEKSIPLGPQDHQILASVEYKQHRTLPDTISEAPHWRTPMGYTRVRTLRKTRSLLKGDLGAVCIHSGRVTKEMLDVHMEEIWTHERALQNPSTAAQGDPEIFQHAITYLMGMGYYEKISRFHQQLENLTKVRKMSHFAYGFATLGARREANSSLINNGEIDLVYPSVDMSFSEVAYVANGNARPDQDAPRNNSRDLDYMILMSANGSSQEHAIINQYFQQKQAASTVSLLHRSIEAQSGIVILNKSDYLTKGAAQHTVSGVTKTLQDWCGPSLWKSMTEDFSNKWYGDLHLVYVTKGPQTLAAGKYRGIGAFTFNPFGVGAFISGSRVLNGGFGQPVQNYSFAPSNFKNISVNYNAQDSPQVTISQPTAAQPAPVPATIPSHRFQAINHGISSGANILNNQQKATLVEAQKNLHHHPTGSGAAALAQTQVVVQNRGSMGSPSSYKDVGRGPFTQWVNDPVNVITGEFYINAVDLSLNGPMPLEIRRNYSSQSLPDSEFGYGWKMAYFPYLVISEDGKTIYAAEMDGSVIAYNQNPKAPNQYLPTAETNPQFNNGDGTTSNIFNASLRKSTIGSDIFYTLNSSTGDTRTFKMRKFPVGTLQYERPYLEKWADNKGNFYTFHFGTQLTDPYEATQYGRLSEIKSSNGNSIAFKYDPAGHVTRASSKDGRHIHYRYDEYGDLIEVIRADNTKIQYTYKHDQQTVGNERKIFSTHLIAREQKPEGRILENDYDDRRRVTVQRATVGQDLLPVRNASFNYSSTAANDGSISGSTTVQDAYNRATRYVYAQGLMTKIQDPLGHEVTQKWYLHGEFGPGAYQRSLIQRIDKRGLISHYKYDSKGNLVERTTQGDITGDQLEDTATTQFTYNSNNLLTSIRDPLGNEIATFYENAQYPWLPTRIEQKTQGQITSTTENTYYQVSNGTKFARGLLQKVRVAVGTSDAATREYTHNAEGFVTSEKKVGGIGMADHLTQFAYNSRGELIQETDPSGASSHYRYDAHGNQTMSERKDEEGNLISWTYTYYNHNEEPQWIRGPGYDPDDYIWREFDGAGRLIQESRTRSEARADGSGAIAPRGDEFYATTFYKHDLFGNLIEIRDPRRNVTLMTYDQIGQMLTCTAYEGDASGGTLLAKESWTYEPGGEIATYTNPLNGVTQRFYTADGKLRRQQNPDGTIQEWRYQLDGRLVKEILPNGSYWETTFEDVNRVIRRTLKDSDRWDHRKLTSESTLFDRRGNVITLIDGEGNTFTKSYDQLNRVVTETGPAATPQAAQQTKRFAYNDRERTETITNALGEQTIRTRDAAGRIVSIVVKNADGTTVRQTTYRYAANKRAFIQTDGNVSTATVNDTFGNPLLKIHADRKQQRFTYDHGGNLVSSIDELGQETKYTYDGLGRLKTKTLPGGAQTTLTYNAAGNLLERQMPGGLVWSATYDTASRKLSEKLTAKGKETRKKTYAYYESGFGTGELKTLMDGRGMILFTYDASGRLKKRDISGTASGAQEYTYDRRGFLKQIKQTGRDIESVNLLREYSPYGDLTSEKILLNNELHQLTQHEWDAEGRRNKFMLSDFEETFTYQADGRLSKIRLPKQNRTVSYTYGNHGYLTSKNNGNLWQYVTRDLLGRISKQSQQIGNRPFLEEELSWNANSTLSRYQFDYSGSSIQVRNFTYNSRGQLLTEKTGLDSTISYEFDGGTSGNGLGVRTRAYQANPAFEHKVLEQDPWGRVTKESTDQGALKVEMKGTSGSHTNIQVFLNKLTLGSVTSAADRTWKMPLSLKPGKYSLMVCGVRDSLEDCQLYEKANHHFSISSQPRHQERTYDEEGNLTKLVIDGPGENRTLKYQWDAWGRLVKVTERDSQNNGYDWSATFDSLGRRLKTTTLPITGGEPVAGKKETILSYFDPLVEFLEVGVQVNDKPVTWKAYGIDKNGTYGGLNGLGGLEEIITPEKSYSVIYNTLGHVVATYDGTEAKRVPTEVGSYGPLPGSLALPLSSERGLPEVTHWQGRRTDSTGLFHIGRREFDWLSGTWISSDPLGHSASWSLMDFCNGDPVNYVDPDGRLGKGFHTGVAERGNIRSDYPTGLSGLPFNVGLNVGRMAAGIGITIDHPGTSYVPVVGTAKDLTQAATGQTFMSGPLSPAERQASLTSAAMNIVPVGVLVKTGAAAGKAGVKALSGAPSSAIIGDKVIHVTPSGVAFPPGAKYQIPSNYVQNVHRQGSYGLIENGRFVEKLRIDPATPPGMKGPGYGHYHLEGSKVHYSPRPGDPNPGFNP